jgi:hypothetical protein
MHVYLINILGVSNKMFKSGDLLKMYKCHKHMFEHQIHFKKYGTVF